MVNILFLGGIYSDDSEAIFLKNSRRGYQFAAQNLQKSLIDGFIQNEVNVTVASVPSLSTFPIGYKKPFVRSGEFIYQKSGIGKTFGFVNLPVLNNVKEGTIVSYIDKWCYSTKGIKVVFVYSLHAPKMKIATIIKNLHPEIKLCACVPDLPRFMAWNKYYKKLGFMDKNIKVIDEKITSFDCFVLLAKPMALSLGIETKPYTIIEGMYKPADVDIEYADLNIKSIMYSGGLNERYGVKDLIDAFLNIQGEEYQLWLCGDGDMVSYIKECSTLDSRIKYYGCLSINDVSSLQRKATILVNPRHSNEEFTKYSFPSKTIEYLASGRPTLMSKLESVPNEYYEHLFFFDDESIDGMTRKIVEVCSLTPEVLIQKGKRAQAFIFQNKNPKVQTKKIINLIQSLDDTQAL